MINNIAPVSTATTEFALEDNRHHLLDKNLLLNEEVQEIIAGCLQDTFYIII